jgi:hypothetical protein
MGVPSGAPGVPTTGGGAGAAFPQIGNINPMILLALNALTGGNNPLTTALVTGLGGGQNQDQAMRLALFQAITGAGGLNKLFQAPNDQGQLAGVPDVMKGYAETGGVDLAGTTDPYALLPHQQEELNQQLAAIDKQKQAAIQGTLANLIQRGLDPQTAQLVTQKLNQVFDNQKSQLKTQFMETIRTNRQNTYANLVPMKESLANEFMQKDATQQSNLRALLGMSFNPRGFQGFGSGGPGTGGTTVRNPAPNPVGAATGLLSLLPQVTTPGAQPPTTPGGNYGTGLGGTFGGTPSVPTDTGYGTGFGQSFGGADNMFGSQQTDPTAGFFGGGGLPDVGSSPIDLSGFIPAVF